GIRSFGIRLNGNFAKPKNSQCRTKIPECIHAGKRIHEHYLASLGSIFGSSQQKRDYAVLSLFLCQKFENLFPLFLGLRLRQSASKRCYFFMMREQGHVSLPRLLKCQRCSSAPALSS